MANSIEISPRFNDFYKEKGVTILGTCSFPIRKYLLLSKDKRVFSFEEEVFQGDRRVGRILGTLIFLNVPPFIVTVPPPMPRKLTSVLGVPRYNIFPVVDSGTYTGIDSKGTVRIDETSGRVTAVSIVPPPRTVSPPIETEPPSTTQQTSPAASKHKREGWLTKQGNFVKNWKRRWFTLAAGGILVSFFSLVLEITFTSSYQSLYGHTDISSYLPCIIIC
eukprot:TRINITY_DN4951_c0_g1_i8.p1 TRINITY_DN4951_c0_g1~~TRINITY_DN4951_c0_g1_i8.p1  ORF type:complete len:247 (-),score=45.49 TRINITY_DN4951_c0_g1_i8:161-820(-)